MEEQMVIVDHQDHEQFQLKHELIHVLTIYSKILMIQLNRVIILAMILDNPIQQWRILHKQDQHEDDD